MDKIVKLISLTPSFSRGLLLDLLLELLSQRQDVMLLILPFVTFGDGITTSMIRLRAVEQRLTM
jgi:hypothetical protein